MPTLYIYFGLKIIFHSREHKPIHVHGKFGNRENKAVFKFVNGEITDIRFTKSGSKLPLLPKEMRKFKKLVEFYKYEIGNKWIDYFVKNKPIETMIITEEI